MVPKARGEGLLYMGVHGLKHFALPPNPPGMPMHSNRIEGRRKKGYLMLKISGKPHADLKAP